MYRCRICLEESDLLETLPCNCRADLGKVHTSCFAQWVEIIGEDLKQTEIVINCQICRKPIPMQIKTTKHLKSCNEIQQTSSIFCASLSILTVLMLLVLYGPIIVGIININKRNYPMYLVYIMMMVFLLIFLKIAVKSVIKIFTK